MKKLWDGFLAWQEKHKTLIALIFTGLFVLCQLPILINHEMSLEESALWARASGQAYENKSGYEQTHTEPQTNLWVWLLTPFARLGFSPITANVISLILVALAVFILFRFTRANIFVKISLLLSSVFIYYNPIIARGYSLIPLALVLIATIFEHRSEKPFTYGVLLLLMSQTHFIMLGLAAFLAVEEIIQILKTRKTSKVSCRTPKFLLPVAAAITLLVLALTNSSNIHIEDMVTYDLSTIASELFSKINVALFGVEFPVFIILLIPIIIFMLIYHVRELLGLSVSLCFAIIIIFCVYNGDHYLGQKVTTLLAILMFWILVASQKPESEKTKKLPLVLGTIFFSLPFLFTIPTNVTAISHDTNNEFSYSNEFSEFIDWLYGEQKTATIVVMQEARNFILPEFIRGKYTFFDGFSGDDYKRFSTNETYESHPVRTLHISAGVSRVRDIIKEIEKDYDQIFLMGADGIYQFGGDSGFSCANSSEDSTPTQYADNIEYNTIPYAAFTPSAKNDYRDNIITFEFYKIK